MASLNKVFLLGNLTRDPDLRGLPSGQSVCELRLAVGRRYQNSNGQEVDDTCFVDVVVWGRSAGNCKQFLSKGSQVMVEGRLQLDQWEDRNSGTQRSRLRVVAEQVQFMSRRNAEGSAPAGNAPAGDFQENNDMPYNRSVRSVAPEAMPPMPSADNGAPAPEDDIPF